MQLSRRRKLWAVAILMLLAAGVAWWVIPRPLSPAERALVGVWIHPAHSGGSRFILEFRKDRTCLQRMADGGEMGPGLYALEGTWRVENDVLISRWWGSRREELIPVRVVPSGRKVGKFPLPTLRWREPMKLQLLKISEKQLTVQWPSTSVHIWARYPE